MLPALWPTHAGWNSADQTMSEVMMSLFKDLVRDEGLSLSDVPGGPSRTELVGQSVDLRQKMAIGQLPGTGGAVGK